jgi:hypothetical protein
VCGEMGSVRCQSIPEHVDVDSRERYSIDALEEEDNLEESLWQFREQEQVETI